MKEKPKDKVKIDYRQASFQPAGQGLIYRQILKRSLRHVPSTLDLSVRRSWLILKESFRNVMAGERPG